MQVGDCAERVERPGDFATLRQKNTDGTYKTLEQFEVIAHPHPLYCSCFFFIDIRKMNIWFHDLHVQNDVYMVFQKAMSINSQDTIPYKEVNHVHMMLLRCMHACQNECLFLVQAMALLDQARQVFLSLKKNRMYSESDLLAWRHKQLDKKAARDQQGGDAAVTPAQQRPSITPLKKKAAGAGASEKKHQIRGAPSPSPVKRARKGNESRRRFWNIAEC